MSIINCSRNSKSFKAVFFFLEIQKLSFFLAFIDSFTDMRYLTLFQLSIGYVCTLALHYLSVFDVLLYRLNRFAFTERRLFINF